MKAKSVNIDSSHVAFKINLYILRELVEIGLIRDEYRVIAVPNKKNKYLIVIPSEEEFLTLLLSESIKLIKLGWIFDLVFSIYMLVLLVSFFAIIV